MGIGYSYRKAQKSNLNPGVPSTRQVIEFQDLFLKDKAVFTGYDASEGVLYVLFMLTLAMHPDVLSRLWINGLLGGVPELL